VIFLNTTSRRIVKAQKPEQQKRGNLYKKHFWPLTIILILSISCARQLPPAGGPEDKTPPIILEVTPEANSTLVPLDQQVEFVFSEAMDRKSAEGAIFITPDPGERVKFKWKKRKLRIEFADSLKENRTYVITLGTGLKDARRNPLKQSYTLAFSTGAEISDGKISGRVYSQGPVQGVFIWAYVLENEQEPDPTKKSGEYITQTDAQGRFTLSHLSEGVYRIFAMRDKNNNRFYDVGTDAIGVPFRDVILSKEQLRASNLNFKMTVQDTIGPALVSVSADDQVHLKLIFDENLHKKGTENPGNYSIHSKTSGTEDSLAIRIAYVNALDAKEIQLITAPQIPKTEYEIEVQNIMDISWNLIDPNYSKFIFLSSAAPDTFKPEIVQTVPKDSAESVFLNSKIELYFNEAMNRTSVERNFQMQDSTGKLVAGTFVWENPALVKFSPKRLLESSAHYVVSVKLDSIYDLFANPVADSTLYLTFKTLNKDTLSAISGTIADEDSLGQGAIYLKAQQTQRNGQSYEIKLEQPGPYEFVNILPGIYVIEGFRDRDNNGEYTFGKAIPFEPAERFVVYSDSINVRARWPNEGNDITFTK
jgi:hypothetical protein